MNIIESPDQGSGFPCAWKKYSPHQKYFNLDYSQDKGGQCQYAVQGEEDEGAMKCRGAVHTRQLDTFLSHSSGFQDLRACGE